MSDVTFKSGRLPAQPLPANIRSTQPGGGLGELWRHHPARSAPRGPEVDHDRQLGLRDHLVEFRVVEHDRRGRQQLLLAVAAGRPFRQPGVGHAVGGEAVGADDQHRGRSRAIGTPGPTAAGRHARAASIRVHPRRRQQLLHAGHGADLRHVADALGAVRDQDVAINELGKLRAEAETDAVKEGVDALIRELSELRAVARLNLTESLAVGAIDDLQQRFAKAVEKASSGKKANKSASFNEIGHEVVAAGWEDLYDLGDSLYDPFGVERLHKMRIVAKRLRYAIELFVSCWGATIAPFAEEIAKMQSHLGDVHDCDIWIENMGKRLELRRRGNFAAKSESNYQAAVWLLSEFTKKRTREYRAALKLWSEWEASRFADRMKKMVYTSG